eukprot:3934716-Rhodomonas_salina.2
MLPGYPGYPVSRRQPPVGKQWKVPGYPGMHTRVRGCPARNVNFIPCKNAYSAAQHAMSTSYRARVFCRYLPQSGCTYPGSGLHPSIDGTKWVPSEIKSR